MTASFHTVESVSEAEQGLRSEVVNGGGENGVSAAEAKLKENGIRHMTLNADGKKAAVESGNALNSASCHTRSVSPGAIGFGEGFHIESGSGAGAAEAYAGVCGISGKTGDKGVNVNSELQPNQPPDQ